MRAYVGGIVVTEVVAALIWDKDKFMICQRPAHKARGILWEFVGGKVEPGETKENTTEPSPCVFKNTCGGYVKKYF